MILIIERQNNLIKKKKDLPPVSNSFIFKDLNENIEYS